MGKLDFLPFAAIQVFLLVWVTKTIANIKFVGKDYIFITGIIILSAILYNVYASQALVLVVLMIIIFFYIKSKMVFYCYSINEHFVVIFNKFYYSSYQFIY